MSQDGHKLLFSWRSFTLRIGIPFVLTRTLLLATGFICLTCFTPIPNRNVWEIGPNGEGRVVTLSRPPTSLSGAGYWPVNIFSRYDAEWYLEIAKNGYHSSPGVQSSTAFFPLYPALMAAGAKLLSAHRDVSILLVGLLISNVSLLVALGYVMALVRLDFDEETAVRTVLYVLVFPTTLFFSAAYTESFFFFAVVGAIYYARRGKWWLAGLAGAAAALTRPPGVLMFFVLALEYLYQRDFRWREIRRDFAALCLIPLALTLHFSYLYWKFGDFLLFLRSEHAWGRSVSEGSWLAPFAHTEVIDILVVTVLAVSLAVTWRQLRPSYRAQAFLTFLMPVASGSPTSLARYCSVIFPLYLALGIMGKSPTFERLWLATSSAVAILSMAMFCQWHYVG
jgi:Gpi18-like mannosyltransferase